LLDRIDIHVDVAAVAAADLVLPPPTEGSAEVAERVGAARRVQTARYDGQGPSTGSGQAVRTNAEADGVLLDAVATPDEPGRRLLAQAAEAMRLVGARLSPSDARGADHRRPGRERGGWPGPRRRGAELPAAGAAELDPDQCNFPVYLIGILAIPIWRTSVSSMGRCA
jgi:magnesium chelatase family protein